jgi:hypothetical protein
MVLDNEISSYMLGAGLAPGQFVTRPPRVLAAPLNFKIEAPHSLTTRWGIKRLGRFSDLFHRVR